MKIDIEKTDIEKLKNIVAEQCMRNSMDWEYLIGRAIDNEARECHEYWENMVDDWEGELTDEDYMYWEEAFVANYRLRKFYNSIWGYDCRDQPPKPPRKRTLEGIKRYYKKDNEKFPPWRGFMKERNEAYKGTFSVINNKPTR